ncbi:uncharacterized protein BDZ99DRAFT_475079 [Mytilinidion resinicola]|uniref:Uncharacterized protein n=1 Tax=Mytilinidion resinicola TaxID=574789 RepID=A0A6A6YU34_9PEZI|nr:uncharacterized protein BDZ99DRAFT_475079 [Mytilinidion resinicola]KAF2811534.1 hypothetical protein BDZ99DRAFT_475079 [Mytilinidion resinicola]
MHLIYLITCFVASAIAFTLNPTGLQENRVTGDQCTPKWRWCTAPVSSALLCSRADNMDRSVLSDSDLKSLASAKLELASVPSPLTWDCVVGFMQGDPCSYNEEQWFPGSKSVDDPWKAGIGSFQCEISNTTCPTMGTSASASTATGTQSSSSSSLASPSSSSSISLSSASTTQTTFASPSMSY